MIIYFTGFILAVILIKVGQHFMREDEKLLSREEDYFITLIFSIGSWFTVLLAILTLIDYGTNRKKI